MRDSVEEIVWRSVIAVEWVLSGQEPAAFWHELGGPPDANRGERVADAAAVVADEVYEHLPQQQRARTPELARDAPRVHAAGTNSSSREKAPVRARVAVIGAGVAGAACAQTLATAAGSMLVSVDVYEKDPWSVGGKLKVTQGKRAGAEVASPCLFFSAVGPLFRAQVDAWVCCGAAEPFCSTEKMAIIDAAATVFPFDCNS